MKLGEVGFGKVSLDELRLGEVGLGLVKLDDEGSLVRLGEVNLG